MIKDGATNDNYSKTKQYKNEEILFQEIEEKIKGLRPVDTFYGEMIGYTEVFMLDNGQVVYKDELGEVLIADKRNSEFENKLYTESSMLEIQSSTQGAYAIKSTQTLYTNLPSYTYGYTKGDVDVRLTLSEFGFQTGRRGKYQYLDFGFESKEKNVSDLFLQFCEERYIGEYSSEIYASGEDKVDAKNAGKYRLDKEGYGKIFRFTNELEAIRDEKNLKTEQEQTDIDFIMNLYGEMPDSEFKKRVNHSMNEDIQRQVERKKTERERKAFLREYEAFAESKKIEPNIGELIKQGIDKKKILKFLLQNGAVREGTLKEQQEDIKRAIEMQKRVEEIQSLY